MIAMLLEAGANPNQQLMLSPPFRNVGNDRGLDGMLTTGSTPLPPDRPAAGCAKAGTAVAMSTSRIAKERRIRLRSLALDT